MGTHGRIFLAGLGGTVLQFVLMVALDEYGAAKFPAPSGFVGNRLERQVVVVANYPTWFLFTLLFAWSLISFVTLWTTIRLAGSAVGFGVGMFPCMQIFNRCYQCSYPIWFQILAFGCLMLAVYLLARIEKIGRFAVKQPEQT